jgi:hypothetical protein
MDNIVAQNTGPVLLQYFTAVIGSTTTDNSQRFAKFGLANLWNSGPDQ